MASNQKHLPFFAGLLLALGILIGVKFNPSAADSFIHTTNLSKQKVNRLIDYLEYEYVDPVDTDSIVEGFIDTVLQNLDPLHHTYPNKT